MRPEFVLGLAVASATMAPSRERGDALVVANRLTSGSETAFATIPVETWLCGTGDIEAAPTIGDLVRNSSRLVQALAKALPPVNEAAEARLDRLMEDRYSREQRKPLTRRI